MHYCVVVCQTSSLLAAVVSSCGCCCGVLSAQCPVVIGWGEEDPWEPLKLGRAYGEIETVQDFVVFPGVGHCPQDEAPDVINPFIASFVAKHA